MNIVITGCGKGIGRATTLELARGGHRIMGCSRTKSDLESLAGEVDKLVGGGTFDFQVVDLANKMAVTNFGKEALDRLGHIDVLVNNAGIFQPGTIHEEEDGQLEHMMNVNLMSAYHLSRAIIPDMKERKRGQIVNICSIASIKAFPNGGSYAITKFALHGMTKCLREELMPYGIRVNAILPGATWSNSWDGFEAPEDRLMKAEDVAKTIKICIELSPNAVIEEMIIRPQEGDL